jgi:ABC-type multidrug transport system fused ATPase/permease subunit
MYILKVIENLFSILTKNQKIKFSFISVFFLFSALLQIVGIASIAPFITILSNQEIIHTNKVLSYLYDFFAANSNADFIFGFAIASLIMIFTSNAISALTIWLLLKFSVSIGSELQSRLYEKFLHREYIFHKTTNYNKIIAVVAHEAPRLVYMVLQPFLLLISQLCIALIILVGLLWVNPWIALAAFAIIGGSYLLSYYLLKKSLSRHGQVVTDRNDGMQAILSESFIGIKDIKLNSLEKNYISSFEKLNYRGLNSAAYITLSGDLPRFVIETISFGAILILAIVLLDDSNSSQEIISILSIYALAGYKLLPTMQQIYKSISSISAHGSVAESLVKKIDAVIESHNDRVGEPMSSVSSIELVGINYQYPGATESTLSDINVKFEAGKLNTIAGASGSGKSTLADIMLGLLPQSSGKILVNGAELTNNILADYQCSIGYIPQSIFILDATVLANVAFGVPREKIDVEKVNAALCKANAMEFVERLPDGICTRLGQDGKLLSGGQRQRIGIARTLYRDNSVLILDEPTSALDIDSEYELMMLLEKLKEQVLTIVISHRPAAIKLSDTITLMKRGVIIASASYEELRETSPEFRDTLEKGMMD